MAGWRRRVTAAPIRKKRKARRSASSSQPDLTMLAIHPPAFELITPVDTGPVVSPLLVEVLPLPLRACAELVFVAPCPLGLPFAAPDAQVGVEEPDVPAEVG